MQSIDEAPSRYKKRKTLILIVSFFVISLLIFINNSSPVFNFIKSPVQSFFSVPKSFLYSLGKGNNKKSEIEKQKEINRQLEAKIVDYELMKKENEALKSQFEVSPDYSQSLVAAKVIGFLGERNNPSAFVINAGEDTKIEKGMPVIFDKYLVGKVSSVSKKYSVVMTVYNHEFSTLVKLPQTGANGIIIGSNDFMVMDQVVITDTLEKGGIVVTKGEVKENGIGVFPDIIVGKIKSISKNETAPFQSAQVLPIIDYSRITDVFVITAL